MRKVTLAALAIMFVVFACQKKDATTQETFPEETTAVDLVSRNCASTEILEEQMAKNPEFRKRRQEIEAFLQKNKSNKKLLSDGTIEIPVVVHVVYNNKNQNISDGQIASQIAVLNEDFTMTNADRTKVPLHFQQAQSGSAMKVRFVLSTPVIRKKTSVKSFSTNDAVKFSSSGGSDAVSPETHLNMWVCNLSNNLLGYAQFPGESANTDGVVILYSAFGSKAKYSAGTYTRNFDRGRTATHEVGHWLNLNHIWGDATCGDDKVADTPQHNTANGGCPTATHRSTCSGTPLEMWMNYMDYTYDACMYMFTTGQAIRSMATFEPGGGRATFKQ